MAQKSRRQKLIEPLLDKYGPAIESAFLAAVDQLKSDVDFRELVKRLERGDIGGALAALHIETGVFAQLNAEIAQAFTSGGGAGVQSMPKTTANGLNFVVRFDAAATEAERILKNYSSTEIAQITNDQITMARNVLSQGLERGDNPRTVALDLVGRFNKSTGKREGGFIGLTTNQQKIIDNAAKELASGTEADLRAYLERKLRNKTFDRYVKDAIKTGKPLAKSIQQKAISRMKDNYLKFRGDMIGRTEAMGALHMGQYQAYIQAIAKGELDPSDVERTWHSAGDSRVRHSHMLMNGQTVGMFEYYKTPSGGRLLYPGDPNGAASEIINCRCNESIRVNYLKRLKREDS
jgi:hypothetical protein